MRSGQRTRFPAAARWYVEVIDQPARASAERRLTDWLERDAEHQYELARCEAAVEIARSLESDGEIGWAFREARWLAKTNGNRSRTFGFRNWLGRPIVAWSFAAVCAAVASFELLKPSAAGYRAEREVHEGSPSHLSGVLVSTNPVVVLPGDVVVDAHSVAVLPFAIQRTGVRGDAEQHAIAAALHENLVNALSAVPGLYAVGGQSVMPYAATDFPVADIAVHLGTRGIVEGTVEFAAGRVRVALEVTDASTNRVLLRSTYERDPGELAAIEREMTAGIALALAHSARPALSASNQ